MSGNLQSIKGTLTSVEALDLFFVEKKFIPNQSINFGENSKLEIKSIDESEKFTLDYNRGKISLKYSVQTRCRSYIQLIRLDTGGSWHNNPQERVICHPEDPFYVVHDDCVGKKFQPGEPHIHFYREGYEDAWAYPIPDWIKDPHDRRRTFFEFLEKCNVLDKPSIQAGILDE